MVRHVLVALTTDTRRRGWWIFLLIGLGGRLLAAYPVEPPVRMITFKSDRISCYSGIDARADCYYWRNGFFSGNQLDRALYCMTTLDIAAQVSFLNKDKSVLDTRGALRNRAIWGNYSLGATTIGAYRLDGVRLQIPEHELNRLLPWIREIWFNASLNAAFDLKLSTQHNLKIGLFPFEIGRGISLGAAYEIAPRTISFDATSDIDQYAWGILFTGEITKKPQLQYNVYGSIGVDESESLAQNAEPVYAQCLNCTSRYRGFGHITGIVSGDVKWTIPFGKGRGELVLQPYILGAFVPTYQAEYPDDADIKMGTLGCYADYVGPKFEAGFETALNTGAQKVKGWDRNSVVLARNPANGGFQEIYSRVYRGPRLPNASNKAPVTNRNEVIVDTDINRGAAFNGKQIGSSGLYNGLERFRNPYKVVLDGNFIVADVAYWFKPKLLRVALAVGYASGGEDPNLSLDAPTSADKNSTYNGFVTLRELYYGKRVRSLLVLGYNSILRPLSAPALGLSTDGQLYASSMNGFSDLIHTGCGVLYMPTFGERKAALMVDLLYFWKASPGRAYHLALLGTQSSGSLSHNADRALGLEVNVLSEVTWLPYLKTQLLAGLFFPGPYYRQTVGKPVAAAQYAEVVNPARYGVDCNHFPLFGTRPLWVVVGAFVWAF